MAEESMIVARERIYAAAVARHAAELLEAAAKVARETPERIGRMGGHADAPHLFAAPPADADALKPSAMALLRSLSEARFMAQPPFRLHMHQIVGEVVDHALGGYARSQLGFAPLGATGAEPVGRATGFEWLARADPDAATFGAAAEAAAALLRRVPPAYVFGWLIGPKGEVWEPQWLPPGARVVEVEPELD